MISIIIPAHNEAKYISKTLSSIKKQSYRDYEIIVVADSCTDDTAKIAKSFGCRVFNVNSRNVAHNRNYGAKKAKGDILIFLDAEVRVSTDYLEEVNKAVKQGYTVGRPNYYYDTKNPLVKFQLFSNNIFNLKYYPHTSFVTKAVFNNSERWPEFAKNNHEDLLYSDQIRKIGKYKRVNAQAYNSIRRFKAKGYIIETFMSLYSASLYFISYKLFKRWPNYDYPIVR